MNKKASERVPRLKPGTKSGVNSQLSRAMEQINMDNESESENPQKYLDIPLSNVPGAGDPRKNIKLTKDKNKMLVQRRKQQQEKER